METSARLGINTRELFVNCASLLYEEHEGIMKMKKKDNSNDNEEVRFSLIKDTN